jgi:hypothetical protein
MDNSTKLLINELIKLLEGGGAHATLKDALDNCRQIYVVLNPITCPIAYGNWPNISVLHSGICWSLVRMATTNRQNGRMITGQKKAAPANDAAWDKTIEQINADRDEFIALLKSHDIYEKIPHGDGQTILREALQMADHTSYHTAEIILLRRLLGAWKS